MKSFYTFFEQAEDTAKKEPERVSDNLMTTFGRHNPPHLGHQLVFDKAHDIAQNEGADQHFYTSHSQDRKKNPLPRDMKINFLKRMFPKHAEKWDTNEDVKTLLQVPQEAQRQGYKNFHMMVGGDRQQDVENLLRKYQGELYDFDNIYTHNAGQRDEDDPISQLSASKLRRAAQNEDFDGFAAGLPRHKGFQDKDMRELFEAIKLFGMKNEDYSPGELRDFYTEGHLFNVGDKVESLTTSMTGHIHRCGTNHLIVITEDGLMFKSFIHDVHLV